MSPLSFPLKYYIAIALLQQPPINLFDPIFSPKSPPTNFPIRHPIITPINLHIQPRPQTQPSLSPTGQYVISNLTACCMGIAWHGVTFSDLAYADLARQASLLLTVPHGASKDEDAVARQKGDRVAHISNTYMRCGSIAHANVRDVVHAYEPNRTYCLNVYQLFDGGG